MRVYIPTSRNSSILEVLVFTGSSYPTILTFVTPAARICSLPAQFIFFSIYNDSNIHSPSNNTVHVAIKIIILSTTLLLASDLKSNTTRTACHVNGFPEDKGKTKTRRSNKINREKNREKTVCQFI